MGPLRRSRLAKDISYCIHHVLRRLLLLNSAHRVDQAVLHHFAQMGADVNLRVYFLLRLHGSQLPRGKSSVALLPGMAVQIHKQFHKAFRLPGGGELPAILLQQPHGHVKLHLILPGKRSQKERE